MLKVIEQATGTMFSEAQRTALAKGPDEQDLVNSGLEETMIAAFLGSIHKVARSYMALGIFP